MLSRNTLIHPIIFNTIILLIVPGSYDLRNYKKHELNIKLDINLLSESIYKNTSAILLGLIEKLPATGFRCQENSACYSQLIDCYKEPMSLNQLRDVVKRFQITN